MRRAIPKISPRARRRNERISAELWRLSDTRMAVQREPQRNQCLIRDLGRKARVVLKVDRQLLAETAGMEVEALLLLDPPPAKEACIRIQGWYHGVEERAPPPERDTIEWMAAERISLYQRVPYPGRSIPVALTPYPVDNFIPEEEEVAWGF